MTTTIEMVVPRSQEDVGRLYVEARVAGLSVYHYPNLHCRTFDAAPHPGCQLGVFRKVGSLVFYKNERRWEVCARADCGAVELATLMTWGLRVVQTYGSRPGHFTRKKPFQHDVSKRTGKLIACAGVAYKLGVDDLITAEVAAEPLTAVVDQMIEVAR